MINRVIEFSGRNKLIVFLLVGAAVAAGLWSMGHVPLDAIPDLSDTQVIVYSRWDRSPDIMEDQVTYPISSAMLSVPGVRTVRGFSDFGYSYVYIIFEEGTDIYWARSRTLEYLSAVQPRLPQGVRTELGPDATGIGWVFQYVLTDSSGKHDLAQLRSIQDWFLRYQLQSVPGVAEVAPLGGFVRQYQVNVDPVKLQAYGIPISRVVEAVRTGNHDVGGRLVELSGAEYMVRGRGYAQSTADLGGIALAQSEGGVTVRVRDVANVEFGPDIRRGISDLGGKGEAVSGIVVMRQGENALAVIERVKARLQEIAPGLPAGVKVTPVYDRSELILRSIDNLKHTLLEELVIVSLVILIFLWHVPSALIPVLTIPIAIVISFVPMHLMGVTANIMSLGGIAIAVGAMVDASIVVVEQTHKKLEVVIEAVKEVGGPSFFALLVIAVAFLPVLALEAQEGRLFRPLAYTKNFSMIIAAVLAITLDPAMRLLFTHMQDFRFRPRWLARVVSAVLVGKIHSEENHPISRILIRVYQPVAAWSLRWKWVVLAGATAVVLVTVPVYRRLGSEFMPPLDEGALLYMPTTVPGISEPEAQKLLQAQDRILARFPEVAQVFGKAGRAETSTDPAPLSMAETVITLRPVVEWRKTDTWYSEWAPQWLIPWFRHITPDHISQDELVDQMNQALRMPGVSNAWTMPIKNRIDMLTTAGGYFLDVAWDREKLARYGLSMEDAQAVVTSAIGGENVTTTVEGRERYPVNVRYLRGYRSDPAALSRLLVPAMGGRQQIPVAELGEVKLTSGPSMLRDENGLLSGYVYVDIAGRDLGSYVEEAKGVVRKGLQLPPGYSISWSGQYEGIARVRQRLLVVIPVTLCLVMLLLFLNTKSVVKTLVIVLAVPFSAAGAIWLLYLLGYNMSVGVWVGLIALMGVDAETAVFMLLYLDIAYEQAAREGRLRNLKELQAAILEGAVKRIRPKFMTVAAMFLGLAPIMWSTGTGADVMKRIAAPMIGGIFTSFLLELVVYPVIYEVWKWHFELKPKLARA